MELMSNDRYRQLIRNVELELTDEELAIGYHFCYDFERKLIGPGMEEMNFCFCKNINKKFHKSIYYKSHGKLDFQCDPKFDF
jgi:hypothetical protein